MEESSLKLLYGASGGLKARRCLRQPCLTAECTSVSLSHVLAGLSAGYCTVSAHSAIAW
jgi:hypothetical protein